MFAGISIYFIEDMYSLLLVFISLSTLQTMFLFQAVQSTPVKRAMCMSPSPELASIDDTCQNSSQCVTSFCQDSRCTCPSNHYYDNCQHTCQADNDEESQITAMKAGTTAVGTFILVVILVIIMVREKQKDDNPKSKKKKNTKDVSKNQSGKSSTVIPEEKPKLSQADRKIIQGNERNGKLVSSEISAVTANKPASSSKDKHVYDKAVFTISTDNHVYDKAVFTINTDNHVYTTVYDIVAFSNSTLDLHENNKDESYEMSTKL